MHIKPNCVCADTIGNNVCADTYLEDHMDKPTTYIDENKLFNEISYLIETTQKRTIREIS